MFSSPLLWKEGLIINWYYKEMRHWFSSYFHHGSLKTLSQAPHPGKYCTAFDQKFSSYDMTQQTNFFLFNYTENCKTHRKWMQGIKCVSCLSLQLCFKHSLLWQISSELLLWCVQKCTLIFISVGYSYLIWIKIGMSVNFSKFLNINIYQIS
jgi:hypothetical protein